MYRVLMVEDEFMVAKRLRRFIEQAFADIQIKLNHCDSLDDAIEFMHEHTIDVLFLDLNLQGKDGFELLKEQLCESFQTIVVSANSERAIEAFDIGVFDFIAKPFTQQRVQKSVDRLTQNKGIKKSRFLSYRSLGKTELLSLDKVLYLKAEGHYCEVHTHSGRDILHDKSLDQLLLLLPESFYRVHRSYAVSVDNIKALTVQEGSKYSVELHNDITLPVGRTKLAQLRARLAMT